MPPRSARDARDVVDGAVRRAGIIGWHITNHECGHSGPQNPCQTHDVSEAIPDVTGQMPVMNPCQGRP